MTNDTRIWMYRGTEARLFVSADDVPADEGWRDAPYDPITIAEPAKPKRGRRPRVETQDDQEETVANGDGDTD